MTQSYKKDERLERREIRRKTNQKKKSDERIRKWLDNIKDVLRDMGGRDR